MDNHPYVPAAFINAIREEGTKEEACNYLQKLWNERCALVEKLKEANKMLESCECWRLVNE